MATMTKRDARAERDERIRSSARRGVHPAQIAAAEGCSTRTVRRVVAGDPERHVVVAAPTDLVADDVVRVDPFRELGVAIATHREAVVRLREVAARSHNDAVVIGACKGAASASSALVSLLVSAGLAPPTADAWLSEALWEAAVRKLVSVVEEIGIEGEFFAALKDDSRGGVSIALEGIGPRVGVAT